MKIQNQPSRIYLIFCHGQPKVTVSGLLFPSKIKEFGVEFFCFDSIYKGFIVQSYGNLNFGEYKGEPVHSMWREFLS